MEKYHAESALTLHLEIGRILASFAEYPLTRILYVPSKAGLTVFTCICSPNSCFKSFSALAFRYRMLALTTEAVSVLWFCEARPVAGLGQ